MFTLLTVGFGINRWVGHGRARQIDQQRAALRSWEQSRRQTGARFEIFGELITVRVAIEQRQMVGNDAVVIQHDARDAGGHASPIEPAQHQRAQPVEIGVTVDRDGRRLMNHQRVSGHTIDLNSISQRRRISVVLDDREA